MPSVLPHLETLQAQLQAHVKDLETSKARTSTDNRSSSGWSEPTVEGPRTVNVLGLRVPHTNIFKHVEEFPRSSNYGDAVYFRMRAGYFEEMRDQPGPGRAYIYAVKTPFTGDKYDVCPIDSSTKEDDVAVLVVNKSIAASKVMGWNLFKPEQEDAKAAVEAARASALKAQTAAAAAKTAEKDAKASVQAMQAVARADEEAAVEAAAKKPVKNSFVGFWKRSSEWLTPLLCAVAATSLLALASARWEAAACEEPL